MDGSLLFSIAGLVGELGGLAMAAIGFRQTWRDWEPDKAILSSLTQAMDRLTSWLTRVFRTGLPPKVLDVHGGVQVSAVASGSLSVRWAPLPSIVEAPEEFANMVERRLTDLLDRAEKITNALEDVKDLVKDREGEIRRLINQYRAEAQANVKKVAVGGLRLQASGWGLAVLGVALQGVGQIMQ